MSPHFHPFASHPFASRGVASRRAAPWTLAAALLAALPSTASADSKGATVVNLAPQQIEVESNGSSYHSTYYLANLVADVRVQVDTGTFGRVKSWSVKIGLQAEGSDALYFDSYAISKSYPWGKRPRSVDRTETIMVPEAAWGAHVRWHCNEMADDLRAQGLGNTAIFSQDRTLELAVVPAISADTNGAGSGSFIEEGTPWSSEAKVEIVCKKWPGAQIPQASTDITVTPAKVVNKGLSILERHGPTGVCKIRLDGWITTDQRNVDVKFRYRNQEGKKSQVWTVNTGESKTANFSHWYDIPNNYDPNFDVEWAETGSVRMVGVSHDFKSGWADYAMDCVEGGPDTLTANSPPKLKVSFVPQGKVMVHGQVCPERLKIVGLIEGRGPSSGYAGFVSKTGYTYISPPQEYSVSHGDKVLIGADYEIDWDDAAAPPAGQLLRNDPRFDFNVTNENDVVVSSLKNQGTLTVCRIPVINPAVQGGAGGLTVEQRDPLPSDAPAAKTLRVKPQSPGVAPKQPAPAMVLPKRVAPPPSQPTRQLRQGN